MTPDVSADGFGIMTVRTPAPRSPSNGSVRLPDVEVFPVPPLGETETIRKRRGRGA
jgi:hypothetical protein